MGAVTRNGLALRCCLVLSLAAASALAPPVRASCPDRSTGASPDTEERRIGSCLDEMTVKGERYPATLYHWGHPATVGRMIDLSRRKFCAFNDTRQRTRQWITERRQRDGSVQALTLALSLASIAVKLAGTKAERERIAAVENPRERVEGYRALVEHALDCRGGAESPENCPEVSDRAYAGGVVEASAVLPGSRPPRRYFARRGPGPRATALAEQRLRGYLVEFGVFIDGARADSSPALYVNGGYRSSTTWGPGVYFSPGPGNAIGHFAGSGIACSIRGRSIVDTIGGAPCYLRGKESVDNELIIAGFEREGIPECPSDSRAGSRFMDGNARRTSTNRLRLQAKEILSDGGIRDAQAYRNIVSPIAFAGASRGRIMGYENDVYVSNCAIAYRRCKPITIHDFETCEATSQLVTSVFGSGSRAVFRFLREGGPTDGFARDTSMTPEVFDHVFVKKWRQCLRSVTRASPERDRARLAQTEARRDRLCPASVRGSGPPVALPYTDPTDPAGRRYHAVIREIGKMCRRRGS